MGFFGLGLQGLELVALKPRWVWSLFSPYGSSESGPCRGVYRPYVHCVFPFISPISVLGSSSLGCIVWERDPCNGDMLGPSILS